MTVSEFISGVSYTNQRQFGIDGRNQACDAIDKNGKFVWYLRTYFPYSCFKSVKNEVWLVQLNCLPEEVENIAKKFGFVFQEGFYNEPNDKRGFVIFKGEDLDKVERRAVEFLLSEEYKKISKELNY